MAAGADRRRELRERCELGAQISIGAQRWQAVVVDRSALGMFVATGDSFRIGQDLQIRVEDEPPLAGTVVRVVAPDAPEDRGIGVQISTAQGTEGQTRPSRLHAREFVVQRDAELEPRLDEKLDESLEVDVRSMLDQLDAILDEADDPAPSAWMDAVAGTLFDEKDSRDKLDAADSLLFEELLADKDDEPQANPEQEQAPPQEPPRPTGPKLLLPRIGAPPPLPTLTSAPPTVDVPAVPFRPEMPLDDDDDDEIVVSIEDFGTDEPADFVVALAAREPAPAPSPQDLVHGGAASHPTPSLGVVFSGEVVRYGAGRLASVSTVGLVVGCRFSPPIGATLKLKVTSPAGKSIGLSGQVTWLGAGMVDGYDTSFGLRITDFGWGDRRRYKALVEWAARRAESSQGPK